MGDTRLEPDLDCPAAGDILHLFSRARPGQGLALSVAGVEWHFEGRNEARHGINAAATTDDDSLLLD
eukprot:3000726-Pyramimonas_sp.AAC.1